MRWMDLETVIQSEVSQKEKKKYHMLFIQCYIHCILHYKCNKIIIVYNKFYEEKLVGW